MGKIDHVAEAMELMAQADRVSVRTAEGAIFLTARAQVHATLAVAEQLTTIANSR